MPLAKHLAVRGDHTADEFASFFTDKVASVRASTATTPLYDVPYKSTPQLKNGPR